MRNEMANEYAIELHMVTLEIHVKVAEFQERFLRDSSGFDQALLDEYMPYDHDIRVAKKTFLEWTEKGGSGISIIT